MPDKVTAVVFFPHRMNFSSETTLTGSTIQVHSLHVLLVQVLNFLAPKINGSRL